MYGKEEAKVIREKFWNGFKRYCARKKVNCRWVLTGVKIKATQLKFFADTEKALVLFQIDHRNDFRRYEVYECFLAFRKLINGQAGNDLRWEEEYEGIEGRVVSAIYFELQGVSLYRLEDHEAIYGFFVEKMTLLEEVYWEYRDLITENLKGLNR